MLKIYFIDKDGWPMELVKGRYFQNALRLVLHSRRITTKRPRCLGGHDEQSTEI